MGTKYFFIIFCTAISLPIFFFEFCFSANDTITTVRSIRDGTVLVSSGQTFELGFFSPLNSKFRYIGIWYKVTPDVVVWVANRNNPLNDSYGEFGIGEKGNLVLVDGAKSVIWASNASRVAKDPVAQLLDSGNFVLKESGDMSPEYYLWQSFDYPTDTVLEGMKLGWDLKRGFERYLTSWKEVSDPSESKLTVKVDAKGLSQMILAEGSTRKARTGPWDGLVEFDEFKLRKNSEIEINFLNNENESCYIFELTNKSVVTRIRLNTAGKVERLSLQSDSNKWIILYTVPNRTCTQYGYCGANAICGGVEDMICQCLTGFTPSSEEEWVYRDWSKGCVRKKPFDCHNGDGFVKLRRIKWPDLLQFWLNKSMSLQECKAECLKNCSCVAYANSDVRNGGSGCLLWFGNLIDMRYLSASEFDQNIYVRLSASEIKSIEKKRTKLKIKIGVSISLGMCAFVILIWCITWRSRTRNTGKSKDDEIELPIFDLAIIKVSTNNFSPTNMLGQGGFGTVYKGTLINGQEIAVKRLAKNSSQGLKEFMNEVELIEKLQHKNLVSLLGCCIQQDERMLVYEYMPNKSLDHYIFDKKGSKLSSWEKNFEIIMGIARGLVYLHQDSKIPIIHRDLKAANVLLDNNMNPKISDFGLARIFDGGEKENRTRTIVGTYGYIPPEYAVDGIFSAKSDVYSFGVLLLEIVSGKKNRMFTYRGHDHNLLAHAWLLWKKGKASELVDECFKDLGVESQVLRCIHVGLLCGQRLSEDRPTMNIVVVMLSNEGVKLPQPKTPGFFVETSSNNGDENPSSSKEVLHSKNTITVTLDGR